MAIAQETVDWKCVLEIDAQIGEEPIWAPGDLLYWVDAFKPTFNRLDLKTGVNREWPMPALIGTYALTRQQSQVVVALATGIFSLDLDSGNLRQLEPAPYDQQHYRFNDGRCDRAGRFWVGSFRLPTSDRPQETAFFYRYDQRGLIAEGPGITISNGLAWSPDNKTMYLADRPNWRILCADFELETGTVRNCRHFADVPEGHIPDGATVDTEGGYWIALYGAGRIVRFLPNGTIDRDLKAPTRHPTMVAFGGPNLDRLFVTTGWHSLDAEARKRTPEAGSIWVLDGLGFRGLPEPHFTYTS